MNPSGHDVISKRPAHRGASGGVMAQPNYSRNYEALMAVVTHLAVGKWATRQRKGIANDLSIDESEVRAVLKELKDCFASLRRLPGSRGSFLRAPLTTFAASK